MNSFRVKINGVNHTCKVPEKWQEVTPEQLRKIVHYQEVASNVSAETIMLFCLLDLPNQVFDQMMDEFIYLEGLDQAIELVQWTFDEETPMTFFKSMLPKIGKFKGPGNVFTGLTVHQFAVAEVLVKSVIKQTPGALNKFIGALYRPFGLPFFPWGEWFFTLLARIFISDLDKRIALVNFIGMLRAMRDIYPYTYMQTGESSGMPDFGMEGLMIARAKQGSFGTYRQLRKEQFTRFMKDLEMTNAEAYIVRNRGEV